MLLIRLMPDIQVGPLGGSLLWLLVFLVAIGFVFTTGTGSFLIWLVIVLVVVAIVYVALKNVFGRVF